MKTLTLTQPWASLVVDGDKQIETRSWKTDYRGPLAIHASKSMTQDAWDVVAALRQRNRIIDTKERGMILGLVDLVGCVEITNAIYRLSTNSDVQLRWPSSDRIWTLTQRERDYGDYTPGRFAWLLSQPIRYSRPIAALGRLGLWESEVA